MLSEDAALLKVVGEGPDADEAEPCGEPALDPEGEPCEAPVELASLELAPLELELDPEVDPPDGLALLPDPPLDPDPLVGLGLALLGNDEDPELKPAPEPEPMLDDDPELDPDPDPFDEPELELDPLGEVVLLEKEKGLEPELELEPFCEFVLFDVDEDPLFGITEYPDDVAPGPEDGLV